MKFFFVLASLLMFTSAHSFEQSRDVLALWDSQNGKLDVDYSQIPLHRKLEFIFNFYGLKLHYIDISKNPPAKFLTEDKMKKFKGIVTWFDHEGMTSPRAYGKWLKNQMKRGKKVLILGEFGFAQNDQGVAEPVSEVNQVLSLLGIEIESRFSDNPLLISIAKSKGKEFVEFERSLQGEIFSFRHVANINPQNEVWLSLALKSEKKTSDVVIVGPQGGYVQDGFVLFSHPQEGRSQWRVNPFKLVEKVFVSKNYPIPDTTTLNGKRIFYSHIDGDGFLNISSIDRKKTCAEIIFEQIISKYSLPITVSVITAEMDTKYGVVKDLQPQALAQRIFNHPMIEMASHTRTHPLSWATEPNAAEIRSYLGSKSKHKGPILSYKIPGIKLDYREETSGSLNYINKTFASANKKAQLLQWSGSCLPPAQALGELQKENFLNINGGDSRMDKLFNSHSHLSSLYREIDNQIQVYSSNANENIYTNLWSPPFSGFKDVIQTFERTEYPERLKPVNIYYHFYSGEHQGSLKSLRLAYDWVLGQDLNPIYASAYAKIVLGFVSAKIEALSSHRFALKNYGELRTFRFPETSMVPDYKLSKNVIGHELRNNHLYVFLGPQDESIIELTTHESKSSYLKSLNGKVLSFKRTHSSLEYELESTVPLRGSYIEKGELKEIKFNNRKATLKVGVL